MEEASEVDANGLPLTLTRAEREENEDELIRLCHKLWLDGDDKDFFDYSKVDKD